MTVKLPTEKRLEFLSLKGGCTGSSESTHVRMPHCWISHVTAHNINHGSVISDLALFFFLSSLYHHHVIKFMFM